MYGWEVIRLNFAESFTAEQQEEWLPTIQGAIREEFNLTVNAIQVEMDPNDDRVVLVTNQTEQLLDFTTSNVYIQTDPVVSFLSGVRR